MLTYTYTLLDEVNRSFHMPRFRHEFRFKVPYPATGYLRQARKSVDDLMQPYYAIATESFGPGHRGLMSGEFPKDGKPLDVRWIYWARTMIFLESQDAMLFRLHL